MTKITLLSDSHSEISDDVIKYLENSDEIWHAGDIGNYKVIEKLKKIKPLRAVFGNIDGIEIRKEFKEYERFFCENVEVLMTHIAGNPTKYTPEISQIIKNNPPKLLICGHSHILKVMFDKKNNILFMNPGAIGKYGFHQVRTLLQFTIHQDKIENLQVVEFKK